MKLHQNISLFRDAVRVTAQQLNIPPEFVEKDYWITYGLFTIFNNEIGKDTVFKGGTALVVLPICWTTNGLFLVCFYTNL